MNIQTMILIEDLIKQDLKKAFRVLNVETKGFKEKIRLIEKEE